ncbi:MAG: SufE family protein [Verrucomicrobiota bacterium]
MKSIEEKKSELLETLDLIGDEHERLSFIVDLGKGAESLASEYRQETFRVEGCTSNLWLFPSFEAGKCHYSVDSDSSITKGIATMLANLYDGHSPQEILKNPPDFLVDAGIPQLLSPNRRNGLSNLSGKIVDYATLYREKYPEESSRAL